MTDTPLDADQLRAMGIGHELLDDDTELLAAVELLRSLGVTLDEMASTDLTLLPGPISLRPDATVSPDQVFDFDNDAEFSRALVLALGFSWQDDELLLTPAEIAAIRFFDEQRSVFGEDDTLALVQVAGVAMARIARSVIGTLRVRVETPVLEETGSLVEVFEAYQVATHEQLPQFVEALGALLRRHLALISGTESPWTAGAGESAMVEKLQVGFVDMVGFTSFTERAGQHALVETVRTFERTVNAIVLQNGGTLVKMIGDEAMFVAPDIDDALRIACELCCLPLAAQGPSAVRIGLASGDVTVLDGDYFGTVVNLASRTVQLAEPNSILVTDSVRVTAKSAWQFDSAGPHTLRGIAEPVELWKLDSNQVNEVAGTTC